MENQLPSPAPQSELAELKSQYNSLHSLVISLMLLMIVISGTFWVFLMRQVKTAKSDLQMVRINYTNAVVQYERSRPVFDEMVQKLQAFSRTNADFAPILAKYHYLLPGATSTPPKAARAAVKK